VGKNFMGQTFAVFKGLTDKMLLKGLASYKLRLLV